MLLNTWFLPVGGGESAFLQKFQRVASLPVLLFLYSQIKNFWEMNFLTQFSLPYHYIQRTLYIVHVVRHAKKKKKIKAVVWKPKSLQRRVLSYVFEEGKLEGGKHLLSQRLHRQHCQSFFMPKSKFYAEIHGDSQQRSNKFMMPKINKK